MTAKKVLSVAKTPPHGSGVNWATAYFRAKDGPKMLLSTKIAVEVYDLATGTIRWTLPATLPEFLRQDETTVEFAHGVKVSADHSVICLQFRHQNDDRELLVLDAHDGHVVNRRPLPYTTGSTPHVSRDGKKVAMFDWGGWGYDPRKLNRVRVASVERGAAGPERTSSTEWPSSAALNAGPWLHEFDLPKLRPGGGMSMSFAPDGDHILTCEGPFGAPASTETAVTIRVYRCRDGALVHHFHFPGPPRQTNHFFPETVHELSLRFHFPESGEWLVSFPDYADASYGTRVVDARTGETVALLSAERSVFQTWQAGLSSPCKAEVALDERTGNWTRLELVKTVLPPRQTATVTRFALEKPENGQWIVKRAEAVVLGTFGQEDVFDLARDGSMLTVRHCHAHQMDAYRLGPS